METALLIDFGSTYTKLVVANLDDETIVCTAKAPSSVNTDVMIGLHEALHKLNYNLQDMDAFSVKLASSSAAGGLRMAVSGLVPELTVEAARLAALGAGAKVEKVYSFELSERELADIEKLKPDVFLLVGGTDGGNSETIVKNAKMLAAMNIDVPIVVAGNKVAASAIERILQDAGKDTYICENVLPGLGRINVEPTREAIRNVFINRIVKAKGLEEVQTLIKDVAMPTPAAVLKASQLLADGTLDEPGLGELLVIDVGGATTDVYSIAAGNPTKAGVITKGLPEPYAKRTVEGDLGVRFNARTILDTVGSKRLSERLGITKEVLESLIEEISQHTERVPGQQLEYDLDEALAEFAVDIAMERHTGCVEVMYSPFGSALIQKGKDLTEIKTLIGTGGPLINARNTAKILAKALWHSEQPNVLKPREPQIYVDSKYIMYAMGLLATKFPDKALRMLKKYLSKPSN